MVCFVGWQEYEAFEAFDNREYFGSVAKSFLSMFQAGELGGMEVGSPWCKQEGSCIGVKH